MANSDHRLIRKILKIGNPVQGILDEIKDFEKSSLLIIGKSGSSKSLFSLSVLKELCKWGYACAYFDIENNNTGSLKSKQEWMNNFVHYSPKDTAALYRHLEDAHLLKRKVILLDCLNKINQSDLTKLPREEYLEIVRNVVSFCKERNIFLVIIEHDKPGLYSSHQSTVGWLMDYIMSITQLDNERVLLDFIKHRQGKLKQITITKKDL